MSNHSVIREQCYFCKPNETIADFYIRSYDWLMTSQNRDGSIGRTWIEKATLTPHCVQLFAESGLPRNHKRFVNSVNWLKYEMSHDKKPYWYGRIPALIEAGEIDWLIKNEDIKIFLEDLDKSRIENFFWFILPTIVAIKKAGLEGPYEKIVEDLMKFRLDPNTLHLSISKKPNYTGLAMLFLNEIDKKKYKNEITKMRNWIIEDHRVEENGMIHWDNSIGVTAYVLMDFAEIGFSTLPKILPLIDNSLMFFKPLSDGSLPEDRFVSTYGTSIHESKLYTTLLATRAMATVLGRSNCVMTTSTSISICKLHDQSIMTRILRDFKRHRNFYLWILIIVVLGLLFFLLLNWLGLERWKEEISLVFLSGIISIIIFQIFEKIVKKNK